MATRTKTVEFSYATDATTLAGSTKRTKTGNTIYLPESSITFRSVTLIAYFGDIGTTAVSMTAWNLGIKLGAVAESTATVTDTVTNSGEAWSFRARRDVTSYFTTNWTGTSMTWEASATLTGPTTANHSFKLIITYEYDDTSTTHIKTVRIPIESTRALLTTTMQTVGGATAIPAVKGSYLPEASVTVRQAWVELWGNSAQNATTAVNLQQRIGGGTTTTWWAEPATMNSARWAYGIVDITGETLTSATSVECSASVTSRGLQVGGMVVVTYEFNASTTTTVYNSLMLGAVDTAGWMGGTAAGDEDQWDRVIYIDEPGTITMKESGVALFFNDSGTMTANVAVGSQTDTAYVMTSGALQVGQYSLVHRIDAAGAKGTAGMTLARGPNDYSIQFRSATASSGWNMSGFMILNYTSGKATDGVGVHAQTRYWHLADTAADAAARQETNKTTPTIPASQYWLVGAMVDLDLNVTALAAGAVTLQFERVSGLGWEPVYIGQWRTDNELLYMSPWGASRSSWQRWPGDPDPNRADIEVSRDWRCDTNPQAWAAWGIWTTWHEHSWTVAGTVSNYVDADGAGLTVNIHRASTGELVKSVTTTTGGAFSTTWGDDVDELYVEVYEDGTHVGRSSNATAA